MMETGDKVIRGPRGQIEARDIRYVPSQTIITTLREKASRSTKNVPSNC